MANNDLIKDVVYSEYARLHENIDAIVNGSFTDFATLSVFGVMLAWKPIANRLVPSNKDSTEAPFVLWLGFSTMIAVLAVIATRDLLKQSIVFFTVGETKAYEEALRASLPPIGQSLFRTSEHFGPWFRDYFVPISTHFRILIIALGICFPLIILWPLSRKFATAFLVVGLTCIGVYASALYHFTSLTRLILGTAP